MQSPVVEIYAECYRLTFHEQGRTLEIIHLPVYRSPQRLVSVNRLDIVQMIFVFYLNLFSGTVRHIHRRIQTVCQNLPEMEMQIMERVAHIRENLFFGNPPYIAVPVLKVELHFQGRNRVARIRNRIPDDIFAELQIRFYRKFGRFHTRKQECGQSDSRQNSYFWTERKRKRKGFGFLEKNRSSPEYS